MRREGWKGYRSRMPGAGPRRSDELPGWGAQDGRTVPDRPALSGGRQLAQITNVTTALPLPKSRT
jgi:hypothetical protein